MKVLVASPTTPLLHTKPRIDGYRKPESLAAGGFVLQVGRSAVPSRRVRNDEQNQIRRNDGSLFLSNGGSDTVSVKGLPVNASGSGIPVALPRASGCPLASGSRVPEAGFRLVLRASGSGLPVAQLQTIDVGLASAALTGSVLHGDQSPRLQLPEETAHLAIGDSAHRGQAKLSRKTGRAIAHMLGKGEEQQPGRREQLRHSPGPLSRIDAHLRRPALRVRAGDRSPRPAGRVRSL